MFIGVSHVRDPASPGILGLPCLRPNGLTWSDQIWHGNTCGVEAYFEGSATALSHGAGPERPSNFGTSYTFARTEKQQPNLALRSN